MNEQQVKNNDSSSPFSHEIILEDLNNDTQTTISEREWHVEQGNDLSSFCLKFTFVPLKPELDPSHFRFVIHNEFYLPRLIQPFPSYVASRGCFFKVCQLSKLANARSLKFSVLDVTNGSLYPLLTIIVHHQDNNNSSDENPNAAQLGLEWNLHLRYVIDVYNSSRTLVQATFKMALPRNDYPIHSQKSFMALHDPSLETDENGNQYLRHDNLILKPGYSTRLHYEWRSTVRSRVVNYLDSSLLTAWTSQLPNDALWLENETGIEKNHQKVNEIRAKLLDSSPFFWNFVRLLFLELHDRLHVEHIQEEKGCAWALENGKGDCTEFAATFAAVMRNLNIPTRLVSGFKFNEHSRGWNRHAWTEVKSPTGEWIPIDPLHQMIGFHPHYLPTYVGNWIKEVGEVEFSIEIKSPRHVDETKLRQHLRISAWIDGEVKRKFNKTKKKKAKVLFLENE